MIIATWNIRGFHRPEKQDEIICLARMHQVDVFCILETKLDVKALERILRNKFQGWSFAHNFDCIKGGRILVLWKHLGVDMQVIDSSPQYIHCSLYCKSTQKSFLATFVYGLYSVVSRRGLWNDMADFANVRSSPWLICGDFNCIKSPEEKINGNPPTAYELRDFQEFCFSLGLEDVRSSGCFFTWSAFPKWSKLDRVMYNPLWALGNLFCQTEFLNSGAWSDHSPSITAVIQQALPKKRAFKFFNMWSEHPDFLSLVEGNWSTLFRGTKQFTLAKKLKGLKGILKDLNAKHFSHISARASSAKKNLDVKLDALQLDPSNSSIFEEVTTLRNQVAFLKTAEKSFLSQKAKGNYLNLGDRNTKFFHRMVKRNAAKNHIHSITKSDGTLTSSHLELAKAFTEYYEELFGTVVPCSPTNPNVFLEGYRLSEADASVLIRPVLHTDVKEALFAIDDDKAPGPDGYSSHFFKKSWNIVGEHVTDAVLEFFNNGKILKQFNSTIISLIPKTDHSPTVSDFRPIACCNVIYKIITKIIADRLGTVLPTLVDHAQVAFTKGRNITENIFLAQELLRGYARKRTSPRCTLKVDLRKAYDTISWEFLENVLHGLGFPLVFANWIMECVSTPSYSIAINGSSEGFFQGKRGIRQGDPMSPGLFLICMEYLSRLIHMNTKDSNFNFHPKCDKVGITHLAFADDLMLFSRGDYLSVKILIDTLDNFKSVSGLTINTSKSCIFTAGIHGYDLDAIMSLVNYPTGTLPVKYLGIPLAAQRLNVVHYAPLVDRIASYINAWTANCLSYAGRLQLIQSVVQGVECFWLQCFPLPSAIISRIYSLCRLLLWGKKRPPVSWSSVCLPKEEGGLGIRDIKIWNQALLAKVLWSIHNKADSLWIKWIHSYYLPNTTFWNWAPNKQTSPLLKRIWEIKNILVSKCDDDIDSTIGCLNSMASGGRFCCANMYDLLRRKEENQPWKRAVWKSFIPPKLSFTLWLAAHNKLSTRTNLAYLDIVRVCPLCLSHDESVDHLFFSCRCTKPVWDAVRGWLSISRSMTTIASALKWFHKEPSRSAILMKARRLALSSVVFNLWKARNALIFEGTPFSEAGVISCIKSHVYKVLYASYPVRCITF
ncbi:hypothetical protein ACS0TY_034404 [Phlomoides rotata]